MALPILPPAGDPPVLDSVLLRALRLLALHRRLATLRREAEAVQEEIDTLAEGFEA